MTLKEMTLKEMIILKEMILKGIITKGIIIKEVVIKGIKPHKGVIYIYIYVYIHVEKENPGKKTNSSKKGSKEDFMYLILYCNCNFFCDLIIVTLFVT